MNAALYKAKVQIKKLVFLPIKAGTGMGAAIPISKKLPVFMYYKAIDFFSAYFQAEFFRARVRNITGVT